MISRLLCPWRKHSCLPRRDSSRRFSNPQPSPKPRNLTISKNDFLPNASVAQPKSTAFSEESIRVSLFIVIAAGAHARTYSVGTCRPSRGYWITNNNGEYVSTPWGGDPADVPVPGVCDGDGITDYAVWRSDVGGWFIVFSSTGQVYAIALGATGMIPGPGDYDGDGKTDLAVWRPNNAIWYITPSSNPGTGDNPDTQISSSSARRYAHTPRLRPRRSNRLRHLPAV